MSHMYERHCDIGGFPIQWKKEVREADFHRREKDEEKNVGGSQGIILWS